eukprot:g14568.t1
MMDPSMDDPMSEEEEDEDLPVGSGGGGKGVVVEGEEIAEEDVYAYGDPDDPLDRVLDVYLADELEDHLYLLQYPMRPADRPSSTPLAVKVKAANHLLEVEHAIKQGGKHFDKNAPAQLRQATQKHTGSRVRPATNFGFGVIRSDEFHITPVHATMQMRPCFKHIDEAKALEIEMDLDDPDNDNGGTKAPERPQQVSFKKKESERATAARKSTYAYKKSIEDAEPWVPLEVHGQNDERSLDEFARMFVDHDDGARRGTTAKEFPPCERYLQGLDYMEEYDENGESFSAGGRGRSLDDSIDLVTAGTSTYSPVKIPSAPVQQLGGDAKRRFPELDPVTLKEVLSHIAELDTVNRRWVPKLRDGVPFGMEHPEIVEFEEERWALQESSLKESLGEGILAPPSCPTFEPYVTVLAAEITWATAASAAAGSRAPASRGALPSFGVLRPGGNALPRPSARATPAGGAGTGFEDRKPGIAEGAASKGKAKADQAPPAAAAAAAAAAGGGASSFAPKRHFKPKPKKRPAKTTSAAAAAAAADGAAGEETAVKLEHEGVGAGGGGSGGSGVEEFKDTAVAAAKETEGRDGGASEGGSRGRRGTSRPSGGLAAVAAAAAVLADGGALGEDGGAAGAAGKRGAARGGGEGSPLPTAKEEPREDTGGGGGTASHGREKGDNSDEDDDPLDDDGDDGGGEGAGAAAAAAVVAGSGKGIVAAGKGRASKASKKAAGGGKAKEEPVGRPKVKPRATRAKPKGK